MFELILSSYTSGQTPRFIAAGVFVAAIMTIGYLLSFYNDYHDLKEAKGNKNYWLVWVKIVFLKLWVLFFMVVIYWFLFSYFGGEK